MFLLVKKKLCRRKILDYHEEQYEKEKKKKPAQANRELCTDFFKTSLDMLVCVSDMELYCFAKMVR